jgi:hypothetical protein
VTLILGLLVVFALIGCFVRSTVTRNLMILASVCSFVSVSWLTDWI